MPIDQPQVTMAGLANTNWFRIATVSTIAYSLWLIILPIVVETYCSEAHCGSESLNHGKYKLVHKIHCGSSICSFITLPSPGARNQPTRRACFRFAQAVHPMPEIDGCYGNS